MKKRTKLILKICLGGFLALASSLLMLFLLSVFAGFLQIDKNIAYQNEHIEYLKNDYYTDVYIPCDEQKLADFNIDEAMNKGVKLNEIAIMGTHNSYQLKATLPKRGLMRLLQIISFGAVENKAIFEMDTLTQQLEKGVRNLEIDIETVDKEGGVSFVVTHDPILDNVSSAYNFKAALEEIALWSENNPGHIPVYLLLEPKDKVPPVNNLQNISLEYALILDRTIRETLGEKLLTPSEVMGEYATFKEMRENNGWPELKKCAGKIIVLLHPCTVTKDYIAWDTSLRSQAVFPMLRFDSIDKDYASFILDNDPETASVNNKTTVDKNKLMVRTRADDYPDFSDERYALAENCGSHIITTDYPPREVRLKDHTHTFKGYMIKYIG